MSAGTTTIPAIPGNSGATWSNKTTPPLDIGPYTQPSTPRRERVLGSAKNVDKLKKGPIGVLAGTGGDDAGFPGRVGRTPRVGGEPWMGGKANAKVDGPREITTGE